MHINQPFAPNKNICGATIRRLRKARHMSQEDLAHRMQLLGLDIQQKAVSRMETGQRLVVDYELLYLAEALEADLCELISHLPKSE